MVQMPGKDGFNSAAHAARHVIIVGGGASGVLLAAQLLRHEGPLRVTIVERRALLGCGVAYSTSDPGHLLNTRVHNMSAFPDDPGHFLRWLHDSAEAPAATPDCFASRAAYGRYLEGLLAAWGRDRLTCHRRECLRVEESRGKGRERFGVGIRVHAAVKRNARRREVEERGTGPRAAIKLGMSRQFEIRRGGTRDGGHTL